MTKIAQILSSRTNWMVIVAFLLNSLQYAQPFLSPELVILINSILTALAVYFRVNPKAQF